MNDVPSQNGPRSARLLVGLGCVGALAVVAAVVYSLRQRTALPPPVTSPQRSGNIAEQVQHFCTRCHVDAPADTFPRSAWKEQIEQMYRLFGRANLPVQPPPIEAVVRFFEEQAPEELPEAQFERSSRPLPVRFARATTSQRPEPNISHLTLAHFSHPKYLDILACEMKAGEVLLLKPYEPNPAWQVLARVPNPAHTEVVDLDGDGIKDVLVADLGNYSPTDRRVGSVVWLRGRGDGQFTPFTLLDGVGRVADVQAADFRGTGTKDLVVAAFGWQQTGEIYALDNQTTDWSRPQFVPRVLDERHGAIHVPVTDLNGDARPDFVALFGQEVEQIVAFLNEGQGQFRKETIYSAPHPGYGSSGIQLVDMDGDGDLDVLYTNGDVLDKPYLLKPYHSVQWLENPGPGQFSWAHHPLTPLYGVHRAVAGDVDGDGDMDVVAVSFLPEVLFPQRAEKAVDAIVLLEQTSRGQFARHTLASTTCDHVSCALGDLLGTGRLDLVTGTFAAPKADHPVAIWKNPGKGSSGP